MEPLPPWALGETYSRFRDPFSPGDSVISHDSLGGTVVPRYDPPSQTDLASQPMGVGFATAGGVLSRGSAATILSAGTQAPAAGVQQVTVKGKGRGGSYRRTAFAAPSRGSADAGAVASDAGTGGQTVNPGNGKEVNMLAPALSWFKRSSPTYGNTSSASRGGSVDPLAKQRSATGGAETVPLAIKPGSSSASSGGSSSSDSEEDPDFWLGDAMPHTCRRRCTNPGWILPFILSISGVVYLRIFGVPYAEEAKMSHLSQHDSKLCGAGEMLDKPFLFFCNLGGDLDLEYPVCRESCPTSDTTSLECMRGSTKGQPFDDNPSITVPDYNTSAVSGLLCKPVNEMLSNQMVDGRRNMATDIFSPAFRMVCKAWEPIAVSAFTGLILAVGFLFLIRRCAGGLVWMGMTVLSVGPLLYGALCLYCWYEGALCDCVGSEMEKWQILALGIALCTMGVLFLCLVTRQKNDIETAISCIEWAVHCIMQVPSLTLAPINVLLARSAVILFFWHTVVQLLSLFHSDMITWKSTLTGMDLVLCLYLLVMLFWIMEYIAAVNSFVSIYITEMWYFHGGLQEEKVTTPGCLALRGLWLAFRYHQGSLILGALATGIAQPFKLTLAAVTGLARMEENPVGRCVGSICCCIVGCYQGLFELLSRNAYMDVAMSSRPFCESAGIAQAVLAAGDTVHLLNGATWLFQLAGIGTIGVLGFFLTQVTVANGFFGDSFIDPRHSDYVFNAFAESFWGAMAAVFVAFPFMMLFDIVADVVLYCHIVEDLRQIEEDEESDRQVEDGWADGVGRYITELAGCSCSIRSKPGPRDSLRSDGGSSAISGRATKIAVGGSQQRSKGGGGGGGGGSFKASSSNGGGSSRAARQQKARLG